ncbi:hypothetical protein HN375_02530 [bacterium]|jgi:putative transposase|nr:hypothetical protein [bacterium]MBT3729836.1 hypothetical protein [bacterium]
MKGNIYHITNRGVEKRKIFLNNEYYFRFINNLYDFNNIDQTPMSYKDRRICNLAMRKPSEGLVDIISVCLMPNHYHILVQERVDGGAGLFSKKVSSGFTQYFNLKNKRSGVLFQGRTKIILVNDDAHYLHLPFYVFLNPIKLIESQWKEVGIKNYKKAVEFLENYKWSSFSETILGKKGNFSDIVNNNLFFDLFDTNPKQFKKEIFEWLK